MDALYDFMLGLARDATSTEEFGTELKIGNRAKWYALWKDTIQIELVRNVKLPRWERFWAADEIEEDTIAMQFLRDGEKDFYLMLLEDEDSDKGVEERVRSAIKWASLKKKPMPPHYIEAYLLTFGRAAFPDILAHWTFSDLPQHEPADLQAMFADRRLQEIARDRWSPELVERYKDSFDVAIWNRIALLNRMPILHDRKHSRQYCMLWDSYYLAPDDPSPLDQFWAPYTYDERFQGDVWIVFLMLLMDGHMQLSEAQTPLHRFLRIAKELPYELQCLLVRRVHSRYQSVRSSMPTSASFKFAANWVCCYLDDRAWWLDSKEDYPWLIVTQYGAA
jgi:hypothetical protein